MSKKDAITIVISEVIMPSDTYWAAFDAATGEKVATWADSDTRWGVLEKLRHARILPKLNPGQHWIDAVLYDTVPGQISYEFFESDRGEMVPEPIDFWVQGVQITELVKYEYLETVLAEALAAHNSDMVAP